MPKIKQLEKCKHPNSRKTKALVKTLNRQNAKDKLKLGAQIKQNLLGEKLQWFQKNLNPDETSLSPFDLELLIAKYLGRFDDELEQIKLKHSIGQRKNRQHANREDIINMTLKSEKEEFKTCGIELPDLLNPNHLKQLKLWTGELRFLQNFKLKRFSLRNLKEAKEKLEKKSVVSNQEPEATLESRANTDCEDSMDVDH
ncbi:translation machinery-associated protein 16 homolog [Dendroctonus ponderosae]